MVAVSSPTALKWWIAFELRRIRQGNDRTRQQAAERLGKATAQIGHLETGRNLPSAADVEVLLSWYGCAERIPLFRELLRQAKRGRDWWLEYDDVLRESFGLFLGLESAADRIVSYHPVAVPDLLQTPAYARSAIRGRQPALAEHEVVRLVELRLARRRFLLERPGGPPRICAVIDEGALRRPVGGAQVQTEQLDLVAELAALAEIEVRVLPAAAAVYGMDESFTWLDFPAELGSATQVVHVASAVRDLYYEEPDEVAVYRAALRNLDSHALDPEQSVTLIEKIAHEFRG